MRTAPGLNSGGAEPRMALAALSCCALMCALALPGCSQATKAQTEDEFLSSHEAGVIGTGSSSEAAVAGNIFSSSGDAALIAFASSFESDMPAAVEFTYTSSDKTAQARFNDESTIKAVFAALSQVNVGSATTVPEGSASATFSFVMGDGTAHAFTFVNGCLLRGGKYYETSSTEALHVYVEDFAAL